MVKAFELYDEFNGIWNELNAKYNIEQSKREAFFVWSILKKLQPKNMIEIGVAQGGSAAVWESASPNTRLFLIDLNFSGLKKPLRNGKDICFKDSTNPQTFESVKSMLNGENVDFLFIDGAHDEVTVKSDFNLYGSLVREGVIAFHDVNSCLGVRKVWDEICYVENINEFKDISKIFVLFPREENPNITPQFLGIGIIMRGIRL